MKKWIETHPFIFLLCACGLWFVIRLSTGGRILPQTIRSVAVYLLLAPFAEELFFRGILQRELLRRMKGGLSFISYANVIASIIFAFSHFFAWGALHAILVIIPSLTLGWLYEKTGNITTPFLLHTTYNLNIFIS